MVHQVIITSFYLNAKLKWSVKATDPGGVGNEEFLPGPTVIASPLTPVTLPLTSLGTCAGGDGGGGQATGTSGSPWHSQLP